LRASARRFASSHSPILRKSRLREGFFHRGTLVWIETRGGSFFTEARLSHAGVFDRPLLAFLSVLVYAGPTLQCKVIVGVTFADAAGMRHYLGQ
jgi:hypothetical protein